MTQWLSHPIQSMWESMSLATQLETYAKFTPKQKATIPVILHACTKCYSDQLVLSLIAIYRMWGAYAASDNINNVLCKS